MIGFTKKDLLQGADPQGVIVLRNWCQCCETSLAAHGHLFEFALPLSCFPPPLPTPSSTIPPPRRVPLCGTHTRNAIGPAPLNQSIKTQDSYANGQANPGHERKVPAHNREATQQMVDLPTHKLRPGMQRRPHPREKTLKPKP